MSIMAGGFGAGGDDQYTFSVTSNTAPAQAQLGQVQQYLANLNQSAVTAANGIARVTSQTTQVGSAARIAQTHTMGLGDALGSIIGRAVAIGAVVSAVQTLSSAFKDAADQANKMGAGTSEWIRSLQDIQAMSGKPEAVSPETIQSQTRLMRAGLSAREAHEFSERFGGEAALTKAKDPETGKQKIDDKTYADIELQSARLSRAWGGKREEFATMAGRLTSFYGAGATAEKITTDTANIMKTLGFAPGATTTLAPQFSNALVQNANLEGGANIKDPMKLAAIVTGMGMGTPAGRVGTQVDQLFRGLSGLTRGTAGLAEAGKREAGWAPGDDAYDKLMKLIPVVRKRVGLKAEQWEEAKREADTGEEGDLSRTIQEVLTTQFGVRDAATRRGIAIAVAKAGDMRKAMATGNMSYEKVMEGVGKVEGARPMQAEAAMRGREATELEVGMDYIPQNLLMERARGQLAKDRKMVPEAIPGRAWADMLSGSKITGRLSTEQSLLYNQMTKEAVKEYGSFFEFGGDDKQITQAEIEKGVYDQTLFQQIKQAETKRNMAGGARGGLGDATVEEYAGMGGMEDFGKGALADSLRWKKGPVAEATGLVGGTAKDFLGFDPFEMMKRLVNASEKAADDKLPMPVPAPGVVPR